MRFESLGRIGVGVERTIETRPVARNELSTLAEMTSDMLQASADVFPGAAGSRTVVRDGDLRRPASGDGRPAPNDPETPVERDVGPFRVDLHAHTCHSRDAATTPQDLVERARAAGLDRIAVTDHGTIEGALRARDLDPELVLVGEEIRCACHTELIGLFLSERIPQRLAFEEVVERIRDQGGVIYAPHPFAYPRNPLRRARRALSVADVVEVVNARAFLPIWNRAAGRAARRRGLAPGAGSDAHFPGEIGRAWAEMPGFRTVTEFRERVCRARPVSRATTSPLLHVASMGLRMTRALSTWRGSAPGSLPAPRTAVAE